MVKFSAAQSERREHPRFPGKGLIAEIRGQRFEVLEISFAGLKVNGRFAVAGGLINVAVLPTVGNLPIEEGKVEVPGRVERVDGELTVVRFSHLTDALTRLIAGQVEQDLG